MGFVSGGGNIAITTALPLLLIDYCIVNIKYFMEFIYLIFYACLRLRFLASGVLCLLSAEYCGNVRGLARNLSDLTLASSRYDILICSETLISDMHHASELLVPGFGCPVLYQGKMPRDCGVVAYE